MGEGDEEERKRSFLQGYTGGRVQLGPPVDIVVIIIVIIIAQAQALRKFEF